MVILSSTRQSCFPEDQHELEHEPGILGTHSSCAYAHAMDEWDQSTQVSQSQIMPDQLDLWTMAER